MTRHVKNARPFGAAQLLVAALGALAGCERAPELLDRAAAQAQKSEQAPHGALAMSSQQSRIDELKLNQVGSPPRGVDVRVWEAARPADNAPNQARVALGRKLYFDPRLSKDGTVACATCH